MIAPEKHLAYAAGYFELELYAEARAEIALMPEEFQTLAPARVLLMEVAMAESKWDEVIALAPELVGHDATEERPWVAWAYALREKQLIAEAQETLLAGARMIDKPTALVAYNLACYACLLGELAEARRLLAAAVAQDKSWRAIAKDDPDLAALRAGKK